MQSYKARAVLSTAEHYDLSVNPKTAYAPGQQSQQPADTQDATHGKHVQGWTPAVLGRGGMQC